MLLCGSVGGGYHFYLVFLMPYLQKSTGCFTLSEAGFYNANAILLYTFISPIAGYAADRLGIRRVLFIAGLCLAGLALTHFYFIGNGTLPLWLFFLTILPLSAFHSPGYVLLSQQFPIKEKFRCLSLGHSLGSMLFSGSTPAICTALSASFGLLIAPVIYFFILIFFGLFAIFHLKKSPLI
jgi:MFS family permease